MGYDRPRTLNAGYLPHMWLLDHSQNADTIWVGGKVMVAVVVVARLWSQSWPFATFSMLIATGRKSTAQSEGPETGDPYNLRAGDWQAAQCLTMHSITELRPRGPEVHAEGHKSAPPPSVGHVGVDRVGEASLRPRMDKRPPIGASRNDVEDAVPSARSAMDARCAHPGPADGPDRIEGACRLISQLVGGEAVPSAAKP